jgi:hypothetical protein
VIENGLEKEIRAEKGSRDEEDGPQGGLICGSEICKANPLSLAGEREQATERAERERERGRPALLASLHRHSLFGLQIIATSS